MNVWLAFMLLLFGGVHILIMKVILTALVWTSLFLGADYLLTGMHNDAIDNKLGAIAGLGAGVIVVFGFVRRRA
jgi:hypothetical protein